MLTGRTVDISESGGSAMLTMEVPVDEIVELESCFLQVQSTFTRRCDKRSRFARASSFSIKAP
jgi:hypothetical protein